MVMLGFMNGVPIVLPADPMVQEAPSFKRDPDCAWYAGGQISRSVGVSNSAGKCSSTGARHWRTRRSRVRRMRLSLYPN